MKYLYLQPRGGLNDILCRILKCIEYCQKYNRVLLLDTINSVYNINFYDYFDVINLEKIYKIKIICDMKLIKNIQLNETTTFYPKYIDCNKYMDILNGNITSEFSNKYNCHVDPNGNPYILPINNKVCDDFIIYIQCGGGTFGYNIFKNLILKPVITDYCKSKYLELKHPFISFQIRNTDYQSNYKKLLNNNLNQLKNQSNPVYVATDCKEVLEYFRLNNINVVNYCHFPDNISVNLHSTKMDPETKLLDLLTDILILSMSSTIISNSKGFFINLVRNCNKNKNIISKMFNI